MRGNKKAAAIITAALALTSMSIYSAFYYKCRINITTSFAPGLYKEVGGKDIHIGDLVVFCPPKKEAFTYGLSKGFIPSGSCPGGTIPFIKKIAALEGDNISIDSFVYINGIKQQNSDIQDSVPFNHKGGIVAKDHVFFLSDYNKKSFDGRYFGELNKNVIISKVKPIFTL